MRYAVDLPVALTPDPGWTIVEEGFTLTREHEVESLLAIGNGYVGSRGSLSEGSPLSAPATFLGGLYDAEPGFVPGLVTVPDWTHVSAVVDGRPLRLDWGRNLEHRRILDMRQGIIWREWRHQDETGRITHLRSLRFASMADRHLLVQCIAITLENYDATVLMDATVTGSAAQVTSSGVCVALHVADRVLMPAGSTEPLQHPRSFEIRARETYRLDRVAALYTSRDTSLPEDVARSHAVRAAERISELVKEHCCAWRERWNASDLRIESDSEAQRAMRFAIYHLVSSANPENDRASIGARGLSGTGYKGHVFWDTDIFMLPFFLLTYPEAARALVMYRYHTLPAARANAARRGYRGALYAWESAEDGEDSTPPFVIEPDGEVVRIFTGEQQQHISADVAYAVWNYWRATGDDQFLIGAGATIMIETARFWASRGTREEDGCYHIRGVIGPDEYHVSVDDNAYTNGMAQWNLEAASEVANYLAECCLDEWQALSRRLGIYEGETRDWESVARDMYTGFDAESGLFEQFRGYFGLEDIDLSAYATRTAPMDVLLGRERIARSKVIKQPDVVMLIYLLWDRFPEEVREANFEYYEPRCGHGSSLSPAIHALVAARLGKTELAQRYFQQAAEIDLENNMGNAAGGVHAGALGGLWQAAVFGFAGLHLSEHNPEYHPNLPLAWRRLSTRYHWRSNWHELSVARNQGDGS